MSSVMRRQDSIQGAKIRLQGMAKLLLRKLSQVSDSVLEGSLAYNEFVGPFLNRAFVFNINRRCFEQFVEDVCGHQQSGCKLICLNFEPFVAGRRGSVALQNGFRELLVDMDFTGDVVGMKLKMRNFMGNRESLAIGMMK